MTWLPCPCCENYWCSRHGMHVHDCPCPPIEEWENDPYAPEETERPQDRLLTRKDDDD